MNKKQKFLRYLPAIVGAILAISIGVGVYLLQGMFEKPAQAKKQIQQIAIVQPPPPPPPPPETPPPPPPEVKEEKLPEPEPEKEPDPAPEEAEEPPGDQLGVDGEGGAGSDGFGLVGKKGGRSLLGGTGGSAILWYGGQVKRQLEDSLQSVLEGGQARANAYTVVLNVWIGSDGRLSRAELSGSSGKTEVDRAIRDALPRLRFALQKSPPENMPQPLRIRVNSRI